MGAEELVKHLTECRNVAAAVVADGDATAVVQQLLADGWTYQGEETVEGKRVRYLVPPPELAEQLGMVPAEHPMRPCNCDDCRVKLAAVEVNRLVPPVGRPHRCAVCGGWFATQHAVRAHHHPAPQPAEQLDPAGLLYELDAGPEYGHRDGCIWPHKICTGHQTAAPQRLACGGCSFATADPDRMDGHLNATYHGAPSQPTYGVLDNGCGSHGYRLTDGCPECALRKHRIALTTSPEENPT